MKNTKINKKEEKGSNIILIYDNECLFCCKFIEWLDTVYKKSEYRLLVSSSISNALSNSLISETFLKNKEILRLENLSKESMIFFDHSQRVFIYSDAFIQIIKYSNDAFLNFFMLPLNLLPRNFLNLIYKKISSNRLLISKLLGVKQTCKKSYKFLIVV